MKFLVATDEDGDKCAINADKVTVMVARYSDSLGGLRGAEIGTSISVDGMVINVQERLRDLVIMLHDLPAT